LTESGVLFHYTDASGLIGIVEDQVLWATDAEFLNDARELRYGREEMHAALLARADELSPPGSAEGSAEGSRAMVMQSAADQLEPGGLFAQRQYHSAYVACFCEDGDLLSQWRAYGAAGGYAIGFRAASLREMEPDVGELGNIRDLEAVEEVELPPLPAGLVKVRYGPHAVESAVSTVLRDVAPEPVGHPGVTGFYRARSLVLPALAEIKHEAFAEEREWRLIAVASIGEADVYFRSGPLGVTPYVNLQLPVGSIAEVVVGPGREQELRQRGVERLLTERGLLTEGGLGDVAIRNSRAPFRG